MPLGWSLSRHVSRPVTRRSIPGRFRLRFRSSSTKTWRKRAHWYGLRIASSSFIARVIMETASSPCAPWFSTRKSVTCWYRCMPEYRQISPMSVGTSSLPDQVRKKGISFERISMFVGVLKWMRKWELPQQCQMNLVVAVMKTSERSTRFSWCSFTWFATPFIHSESGLSVKASSSTSRTVWSPWPGTGRLKSEPSSSCPTSLTSRYA
mmetsp:Transcript_68017/g.146673  ORF Transcript_68017/g.146673 Transcript_68017/m.146673 type:complete len:208 (-) Transcript_68017:5718-6341(-)